MNILCLVISPKNIFDIQFLQKLIIFVLNWIVVYLATFFNIFNSCSFFFFYELKITQYFAKMPNFNISENNPVNTLEGCKQTLWEVNKKVEWFLKRGFGEFLHSNLWKQSYIKTPDSPKNCRKKNANASQLSQESFFIFILYDNRNVYVLSYFCFCSRKKKPSPSPIPLIKCTFMSRFYVSQWVETFLKENFHS